MTDAASGRIVVDDQEIVAGRGVAGAQSGEVRSLALRPEAVSLDVGGDGRNAMQGTIEEVAFLGAIVRIRVRFRENAVSLDTFNNPNRTPPARGEPVTVSFARDDVLVLEEGETR